MSMLYAELFAITLVVTGAAVGLYLQFSMEETGQISIAPPSPFKEKDEQAGWVFQENPAHV